MPGISKHSIRDLAYFGGSCAFEYPLHVVHASVSPKARFLEQIEDIFQRGQFTNDGPVVQELERRIAERLGVKHCVAVCNGTIGLQIAARALGMRNEVIMPSFTFIATAHALEWLGIHPVFCDIDPVTHALDPLEVERAITPRTTGIIGVHIWGEPCDIGQLTRVASENGLRLAFDAAQAFGASSQGLMVGNFGDVEVFSFHATKMFHTFEGGAVVTNNDETAARARLLRNYGFVDYDNVATLGINGKMNEICAAMGLAGLDAVDDTIRNNRARHACFARHLEAAEGVTLKMPGSPEGSNYQYVVIEINTKTCSLNRDQIVALLQSENVLARRYFYPGCHRMEPYRSNDSQTKTRLPNTESLCERIIALPTGERTNDAVIEKMCSLIRFIVENSPKISARLQET